MTQTIDSATLKDALREHIARQESIISDVLGRYMASHGCPCDWPQFVYWVSKSQGPGWQDSIQNDLVEHACRLTCFQRIELRQQMYGLESQMKCLVCGKEWLFFSEEWRMLAFQKRLVPVKPSLAAASSEVLVDANFFATVGQEPRATRSLSLIEWAEFMLGNSYHPPVTSLGMPDQTKTPDQVNKPQSSLRRMIDWLKKLA
jgi:hypothetical protein